jgi:RES domain
MAQFASWRDYSLFAKEVRSRSRYVWSPESERFLKALAESFSRRLLPLKKGRIFWRAQLGYDFQSCHDGEGREWEEPIGYSESRMTPLRDKALEGRANPKGIPYLYLSDKAETAMSEVRPWLGSIISIAQFGIERDLNVVACISDKQEMALNYIFNPPDKSEYEEIVWREIDSAFSKPVTRLDDSPEYAPTQIIAESIKHAGHDGIIYRSNFGTNGYNIVLFDIAAAKLRNCGIKETKAIKLDFEQAGNTYYVK